MVATTASKKPAACRTASHAAGGPARVRLVPIGSRPGPLCQNELGKGSLDVTISARSSSAISGPMRASARTVPVAGPLGTVASICVSPSTSGQVLADFVRRQPTHGPWRRQMAHRRKLDQSFPSHNLTPRRRPSQADRQFAARHSPRHPARRSGSKGRAEQGWSVSVRSAHVARLRPAARTETPAVPVVPGDLDTLRAWAVAAGDVRSAFLLRESVMVPQRT